MALTAIDPADLPDRTSTGGQSSIPEADQAQMLELVSNGQSVSDGAAYDSAKDATKVASVYKRFLRRQIAAGNVQGQGVRIVTFPVNEKGKRADDGTKRGWAVFVTAEADEAE